MALYKQSILEKWPRYSKMVHDTIMEAPDSFYFIMDNRAHRKVVYEICKHYNFHFKTEVLRKFLRDLPLAEQEKIIQEEGCYHGHGCEDCGGVDVYEKKIIIRKNTPKTRLDVDPIDFNLDDNNTNALQRPRVYPL
eukprot:TRINITY_DN9562_c0_g1_i1.p1 TRINITY_DN9562_c0_g1~~TRINITY_DN9562_c0_g1_i1.p1  ORF type:complete len:136 (-),score=8.18 TRINITY_DN9562_c0_g1_i1:30-437(-)